MYTCTVHSALKMSFVVPQVLNVILKLNSKNYLEDDLKMNEAFKKQFLVEKNRLAF